jgi:hypothetical protein
MKIDSSTLRRSTYSLNSSSILLSSTLVAFESGIVLITEGGVVSTGPPPGGNCPAQLTKKIEAGKNSER